MSTSHTYVLKILLVILIIIYIVYINTQINNSHAHNHYENNNTNEAVNREEVISTNLDYVETEMQLRRNQVKKTCLKYGRKLKVPLKLYNKRLRLDFYYLVDNFKEFSIQI